jgi:hypothetical protein
MPRYPEPTHPRASALTLLIIKEVITHPGIYAEEKELITHPGIYAEVSSTKKTPGFSPDYIAN